MTRDLSGFSCTPLFQAGMVGKTSDRPAMLHRQGLWSAPEPPATPQSLATDCRMGRWVKQRSTQPGNSPAKGFTQLTIVNGGLVADRNQGGIEGNMEVGTKVMLWVHLRDHETT